MKRIVLAGISILCLSSHAVAVDRIGKESGTKGFVFVGAGYSSLQTNMVAEVGGTEVSDKRIDSLQGGADDKEYVGVAPAFNVTYTFAGPRTQLFAGVELEDFLTQDGALGFGVRQGIGSLGIVRASLLASIPLKVWKDPYLTNVDRSSTDRTGFGVRLGWEHIFESDLDLTLTTRSIELEDERSGQTNGLTESQRQLLYREGDINKLEVSYTWIPSPHHVIQPGIVWIDHDLDGDAMAMDGYSAKLSYAYLGLSKVEFLVNLLAGKMESDTYNPIFAKKEEVDRLGGSITMTYVEPFGMKNWRARAVASTGGEDSNIDFYDMSVNAFSIGALYNF
nr:DUF2860 family protein [Alcanivorax sp. S6407]